MDSAATGGAARGLSVDAVLALVVARGANVIVSLLPIGGHMRELPSDDQKCFTEAMMLACALIGSHASQLDVRLALQIEKSARGISDESIHVIHRDGEHVLYEDWIEVRTDGSGRRHESPPPSAEGWPTIELDATTTPARDRLNALAIRAERLPRDDAATEDGLEFLRNALAITAPGAVPPSRAALRALAESGEFRRLVGGSEDPWATVNAHHSGLLEYLRVGRERGEVDGLTSCDVLIGVHLARAIAEAAGPHHGLARWVKYLTFACLQIGDAEPNLGPVLAKAVREGFAPVIDNLSGALLEQGEEFRRRALEQETPNRIRFAKTLYDGYPFFLAARQLARALIDLLPRATEQRPSARRFRVAEERSVRFVDGMIAQWSDLGDVRLREEREQIARAHAAGDERTVRTILAAGEEAMRRPRCVRDYLLAGEGAMSG